MRIAVRRCISAMALLIEQNALIDDIVGETIDDYTVTIDDVENALRPVLAYVEALLDQPGAEYLPRTACRLSDHRRRLRHVDLLVRIGTTIHVIDFKFGSGVWVLALYPDGDEDVVNAQLCSTPPPRATRFPNSLPASTTSF